MDLRTSHLVRPVIPGSRNITSWSSHILSPRLIPWTASFHLLNFIPIYDKKNYKFVATDKTDYLSDCQTLHLHHTLEERGENENTHSWSSDWRRQHLFLVSNQSGADLITLSNGQPSQDYLRLDRELIKQPTLRHPVIQTRVKFYLSSNFIINIFLCF